MKLNTCINCDGARLYTFLDLGKQPNTNNFPSQNAASTERVYPIAMQVCLDCWQVQLESFPSPHVLFENHPYVTGLNAPVVAHFKKLSRHIVKKFSLKKSSLVLDIGCNDGSLLSCFSSLGMQTLGVDPGNRTMQLARDKGIVVKKVFWKESTGRALAKKKIFPKLICATAVFYHVPDIHDFIKGVKQVMRQDTICMIQCLYLKDVIEKNQFENIYHEHRAIHAVTPLVSFLARHALRVVDVEFSSIHGGSFILYIGRNDYPQKTSSTVARAIKREHIVGLDRIETYKRFTKRAYKNMQLLRTRLVALHDKKKTVYALGAPAKGNMLLNASHITKQYVQVATEVNTFKIGRVLPGSHIPVVAEQSIQKDPDYYLILSWNYVDFFRKKYATYLRDGGKFIIPVPHVHIVAK